MSTHYHQKWTQNPNQKQWLLVVNSGRHRLKEIRLSIGKGEPAKQGPRSLRFTWMHLLQMRFKKLAISQRKCFPAVVRRRARRLARSHQGAGNKNVPNATEARSCNLFKMQQDKGSWITTMKTWSQGRSSQGQVTGWLPGCTRAVAPGLAWVLQAAGRAAPHTACCRTACACAGYRIPFVLSFIR